MNIAALSVIRKSDKRDKTEYSRQLQKAFADRGDIAAVREVRGQIPFIEREMKRALQSKIDCIVVAEALGKDCERDFRRLFAGIIYRGEAKVQEKPYSAPRRSLGDRVKSLVKGIRSIPQRLKNPVKRNKEPGQITEIPYSLKKTQVFTVETGEEPAYTFSYRGARVLVLPKGTEPEKVPELVVKACNKFRENREKFPGGYRLVPKTYRVLSFAQRNFPRGFDSAAEKLRKSVRLAAVCILVVAACMLVYNLYVLPMQNEAIQSDIQTIFYQTETDAQGNAKTAKEKNWEKLRKINSDIKGWIQIDNTRIDYPVLQHKGDSAESQFYLYRDYKKGGSGFGSIFIDYRSKKGMDSKNIVLHGHHMMDGSMFSDLMKYGGRGGGNLSFYKKSPTIQISTPKGGTQVYKIISVFKSNVNPEQGEYFDFYCGSFRSDAQFMNYVYNLRIRSLINCPVTVNEDDQIISLTTCSYEFKDFRTVVVARKCRKGESTKVDVGSASLNHSAIWPQCYYSRNGSSRPAISTFKEALKDKKIDWYDGDARLKGSEELPTTYTEPTTEPTTKPTEKATQKPTKPKMFTVKFYNRGKLVSTLKVEQGKKAKTPKIAKSYISGRYKYIFKGWKTSGGKSLRKVTANIRATAKYKKTKIIYQKPTKATKATKATKPVQETQKPEPTQATVPETEPEE